MSLMELAIVARKDGELLCEKDVDKINQICNKGVARFMPGRGGINGAATSVPYIPVLIEFVEIEQMETIEQEYVFETFED